MVALEFTLMPEAAARVHDILVCLSKFSEDVSIEAKRDRLSLTALNSSKSAYASFSLDKNRFFSDYHFNAGKTTDPRFTCRIYCKAMLSVFKKQILDNRGRDTAIDRCEVCINESPDEAECRLIVKMVCNPGVVKTYKLTYEHVDVMHALFDKNSANNRWSISSQLLREYTEYFGRGTEQLDIYADEDRVTFTSFTEKITHGKEVLKYPLRTAVSANKSDFDRFNAQDKLHIIISVKDFKAIVAHADTLKTNVSALYSLPARPLQFSYEQEGMYCEFTLMTTGDNRGASVPPVAPAVSGNSASSMRSFSRTSTTTTSSEDARSEGSNVRTEMPPPKIPASRASTRRTLRPTGTARSGPSHQDSEVSESLFVQQDEDDRQWDPSGYGEEEDTLGWDANADNENGFHPTFQDSGSFARIDNRYQADDNAPELDPTQRLSQVQGGLW